MYLSQLLVFSVPLATLVAALPTAQSSTNYPLPWGVPTNNVICDTPKESRTSLLSSILAVTITQSMNKYQASVGQTYAPTGEQFPKIWGGNDSIALDAEGQKYTIIWAPGCDLTATILYTPLQTEPTQSILSATDIVLFSATLGTRTSPTNGHYCAVLTNSDAAAGDQLSVNGKANEDPKGYHQCNELPDPPAKLQA